MSTSYPSESFFRSNIRQTIEVGTLPPFTLKVTKVPTLSTGLLTISPNTNNEEIVEYSAVDAVNLTITVSKRGIKWDSQVLTTDGAGAATGDYNNSVYMRAHSQNDQIQADVTHLHLIQDYAAKLDANGGLRTGMTPNSVMVTDGSGNETYGTGGFMPTGGIAPFAGGSSPTGYLLCNGAAVSRTTYSGLLAVIGVTYGAGDGSTTFNVPNLGGRIPVGVGTATSKGTATITIATPGVITNTGHGLCNGTIVYVTTTGALPTGLTANVRYYVVSATANTFSLATTLGGAAITTSGTQSGTHTLFSANFDLRGVTGGTESHILNANEMPSHNHQFADGISGGSLNGYMNTSAGDGTGGYSNTKGANLTQIIQNTGGSLAHNNLQPYLIMNYIIKT